MGKYTALSSPRSSSGSERAPTARSWCRCKARCRTRGFLRGASCVTGRNASQLAGPVPWLRHAGSDEKGNANGCLLSGSVRVFSGQLPACSRSSQVPIHSHLSHSSARPGRPSNPVYSRSHSSSSPSSRSQRCATSRLLDSESKSKPGVAPLTLSRLRRRRGVCNR